MTSRAQTVTILFTDLVGSTELLQRAGDEQAQHIFKAHHRLLREAVEAHGGHEVKWLGDGLMVAFDSTRDAAQCAIAMQQAARRPAAGERLQIRVGLHVGEAFKDESDYFGTSVVIARRLCDTSDDGEIRASDLVVQLLEDRDQFAFEDLGELRLKGITKDVHTWRLQYQHDPLAMLAVTPFVGREDVIATLTKKLDEARSGAGALVMLVGEPGIGKTRLIDEFSSAAAERGACVLRGRCYDGEWAPPFSPFVEALREYVCGAQAAPEEELRALRPTDIVVAARIVPELRERLPDLEEAPPLQSEGERYRLLEAVSGILGGMSAKGGLLLVLDDLHWADKGTIAMLLHIARTAAAQRIMVLGAYRDVELDRQHPLTAAMTDLRRETSFERIVLKGLAADDIGTLLDAVAESAVGGSPRPLVEAIASETNGNPFFVREVLLHLVEERKIVQEDGRWTSSLSIVQMGIPEGVREVIGRRLSRLSDGCNELLMSASALTGGFTWPELEAIAAAVVGVTGSVPGEGRGAETGTTDLLDTLDEALRSQLLVESAPSTYDFVHALVRHTLYDEMSTPRRMMLHRRIGDALERLYADDTDAHVAELAHHFHAAHDAEHGVAYGKRAGERAMSLTAYDEAAAHYQRAIELQGERDPQERAVLLLARGAAEFKAGSFPISRQTFYEAAEAARAAGDRDLFVRAAMQDFRVWGDDDTEMRDLLQEAYDMLPPEDSGLKARVLAYLVWRPSYQATMEERRKLFDRAVDMARRTGTEADIAYVIFFVHWGLRHTPEVHERTKIGLELLDISSRSTDEILKFMAHHHRLYDLLDLGEIEEAVRHIVACEEVANAYHLPQYQYLCHYYRACLAQMRGDYSSAAAHAGRGAAIYPEIWGQPVDVLLYGSVMGIIAADQGRYDDLLKVWEPFRDTAPPSAIPLRGQSPAAQNVNVQVEAALASLYAEAGRLDDAAAMIDRCLASGIRTDLGWPVYSAWIAMACGRVDDPERAAIQYERMLPYNGLHLVYAPGFASLGAAAPYLGILASTMGRYDDAERHFEDGLAMNERMGARPFAARTQLDYARMLVRRDREGDRARARGLLEAALETARELGMAKVAADCEDLLARE